MKTFEQMTTKNWCSLYAAMNKLLEQKVITFDLDKSYVEFHTDEAMSYLEKQNVDLHHQLEVKNKIIDEAIAYIKKTKNYIYDAKRDSKTRKLIIDNKIETDVINKTKLLEILERESEK